MSVDRRGEPDVTRELIVHRRDVPQLTVYSWSRDGNMHSAWPGDGKEVPVDGCEIHLRIVAFPNGSVREIHLDKEARTHPHPSDEAVLFYQVDGRRVQMVNEHSHQLDPGGACLQPSGVQHSTFQLIGGLFVEFAMPAPRLPNPEATWIDADAARVVRRDDAGVVKVFDLPGYPLYETSLRAGGRIEASGDAAERMFYVVRGRMRVQLGTVVDDVATGDCLRSEPGMATAFTALDDTVYIETAIR